MPTSARLLRPRPLIPDAIKCFCRDLEFSLSAMAHGPTVTRLRVVISPTSGALFLFSVAGLLSPPPCKTLLQIKLFKRSFFRMPAAGLSQVSVQIRTAGSFKGVSSALHRASLLSQALVSATQLFSPSLHGKKLPNLIQFRHVPRAGKYDPESSEIGSAVE
jgi:hypothetical protein